MNRFMPAEYTIAGSGSGSGSRDSGFGLEKDSVIEYDSWFTALQ